MATDSGNEEDKIRLDLLAGDLRPDFQQRVLVRLLVDVLRQENTIAKVVELMGAWGLNRILKDDLKTELQRFAVMLGPWSVSDHQEV